MEGQVNNSDPTILAPFAGRVRIPDQRDKIFKDECFFCFDSPVSRKMNSFEFKVTTHRIKITYFKNTYNYKIGT